MRTRKWAATLAVTALALGMIGAGVAAQFSDSGTATESMRIGAFDIELSCASGNPDLPPGSPPATSGTVCTPGEDTVAFVFPDWLSSGPGGMYADFKVKNTGDILAVIHIAPNPVDLGYAMSPVLTPGDFTLAADEEQVVRIGLEWAQDLDDSYQGWTAQVVYTVSATE